MNWFINRRRMKRIDWQTPLDILHPDTGKLMCDYAQIRNVSKNGLHVLSSKRLAKKAVYVLQFHVFDRLWNIPGRVLHEKNNGSYFFYGVKFNFRTLADRHDWTLLLSHHSPELQIRSLVYGVMVGAIAVLGALHIGHVPLNMVYAIFFAGMLFYALLLPF